MSAATPSTPRRSPRKANIVKSETEVDTVQVNGVEAEMNNEESDSDNADVLEVKT